MKLLLVLFTVAISGLSYAQIEFNTGDKSLDAELNVVNTEANTDLRSFKTNLSAEFSVEVPQIENLLQIMKPAEAFLALKIRSVANVSLEKVVATYKANKDKGWGYIAKELGIKPGSAEFHALKGKPKKAKAKASQGKSSPSKSKGKNK